MYLYCTLSSICGTISEVCKQVYIFLSVYVLSDGYSSAASQQPGQSGQFASRHQALPDHQQ